MAHSAEEYLFDESILSFLSFGLDTKNMPRISKHIKHNDVIEFGNTKLKVIEAPGHTPGCVLFYCKEQNFAVVGDVLFKGSIGRTDLPGGDYNQMMDTLEKVILNLPDNTTIYPGHGQSTTISFEKLSNEFLRML